VRIALLEPPDPRLARMLGAAGHDVTVLGPTRAGALLEAALRPRKLGEGLGHVAPAALALRRGRFDLAHAFTPASALAGAAVLTFAAPVTRERLADRRLTLATLERALAGRTVVASDDATQASLRRWLGVEARVLDPADGPGHAALYAELLECRP
jgi:hypothetical protein